MEQPISQNATCSPLFARRYAIKIEPPTLSLEYEDVDGKRRVRAVKLVNISPSTDVDRLTRKVIRSFPRRLDSCSVKYEQVRKLVFRLVDSIKQQAGDGRGKPGSVHVGEPGAEPPTLHPSISPKLGTPQLTRVLGTDGLRHSSESRFSTSTTSLPDDIQQHGALDELDDMLGELDRELDMSPSISHIHTGGPQASGDKQPAPPWQHQEPALASESGRVSASGKRESNSGKSRFAQEADQLVLDLELPEDLNQVSEVELQMAKARMEEDFVKNQIRPGDEQYQYDKQVEFAPATADNEWDDSGDDEAEDKG